MSSCLIATCKGWCHCYSHLAVGDPNRERLRKHIIMDEANRQVPDINCFSICLSEEVCTSLTTSPCLCLFCLSGTLSFLKVLSTVLPVRKHSNQMPSDVIICEPLKEAFLITLTKMVSSRAFLPCLIFPHSSSHHLILYYSFRCLLAVSSTRR